MPNASSNMLEVGQLNQQPSISKSSLIWSNLNFIFVFDRIKKLHLRGMIFQMYGSRSDHEFQEYDHVSRVACICWTNCYLAAMIVAAKLSHCKSHRYIWQFEQIHLAISMIHVAVWTNTKRAEFAVAVWANTILQ